MTILQFFGSRKKQDPRHATKPLAIERLEDRVLLNAAPFTLGGDPVVDPADFRSTAFASGLNNPFSMQELSDGSILVGTSSTGSFSSSGQLLRLVDNDSDGVADDSGTVLFGGLPPRVTSVRLAGELVFVNSVGSSITVLRQGATPANPYTLVGSINFNYPAGREHLAHTLAVRPTPGQPGLFDVFFNLGAAENFAETTTTVPVSGLLNGNLAGDAIHMFTVDDTGANPVFSNLTQIATGVRNPGGLAFHPVTGDLYFSENGIDGLVNRNEPLSADELNLIAVAEIGGAIEDFGFPDNYIEYRTGTEIGSGGIDPLYAFQPLPNPQGGPDLESEGPVEIAFAPTTFPEGLNDGVFVTFHGKGSVGAANEENPLVYASLDSSHYFHFISNQEPAVGPIDSVLATTDSIFLADFRGGGAGAIYQIQVDSVVDPENLPPEVIAPIADLTVPENSPSVLDHADLNAVFDDPDNLDSELVYTLEANTPAGIVTVTLAADDTLDLSFVANASGVVDITVRATDPGALFAEDTFQVTVTSVNSPPQVVNQIPNLTVDLGSPPVLDYADLNVVFEDPDNLDSELTYNLVGNVPAGIVNVTLGPDDKLDLSFLAGATGTAVITVRATDPGLLFAEEAFLVTVTPDNQAPQVVNPIPNLTVPRNSPPVLDYSDLNAVFQDPDDFDSQLFYTISANAPSGIVTVDIGPDDRLDLSFAAGASGTVNITVRATDPGLLFAEDMFRVTILGSVTAETVGLHDAAGGRFFFNNTNSAGPADLTVRFGPRGVDWLPLGGDWNGNDFDTPGLYVPESSTFFLRNTSTPGVADLGFVFGTPGAGWLPVAGDWNGNGFDSPGLYNPKAGRFLLRNFSAAGPADTFFRYGPVDAGWVPIAGDWDGDGIDGVGLFDFASGRFFLKNEPTPGPADVFFRFGPAGAGWQPIAGDWDGDGDDNVGLYDPVAGRFYLITENAAGIADLVFSFGPKNAGWTPLAGDWNGPTISGSAAGTEGTLSGLEAPAAFTHAALIPPDQGPLMEKDGPRSISVRDTGRGHSGPSPFLASSAGRTDTAGREDILLIPSVAVSSEDQPTVSHHTILETALLEWVDELDGPLASSTV